MSEEQTERFEGGTPFEIRVLRELANINHRLGNLEGRMDNFEARLTGLEEKVDARLHDTRPIWESVLSRLDSLEAQGGNVEVQLGDLVARVKKVDTKFEVVAEELLDMRTEVKELKKRPPAA